MNTARGASYSTTILLLHQRTLLTLDLVPPIHPSTLINIAEARCSQNECKMTTLNCWSLQLMIPKAFAREQLATRGFQLAIALGYECCSINLCRLNLQRVESLREKKGVLRQIVKIVRFWIILAATSHQLLQNQLIIINILVNTTSRNT